jgi:tetratricopeptide (TPR) repeat protein
MFSLPISTHPPLVEDQPWPMKDNNKKSIWVFTPSRTDPKDLEFILVQRHQLVEDAVERVRESVQSAHKHHLLFVGPRGCGKTHLVTLIVSRLQADPDLCGRMRIAWLNEDETCTSFLELLLKIHTALERGYPEEYRSEMLDKAYDQQPEIAQELITRHLLSTLASRTLVVVAENLDAIFGGLGPSGQKQLRAFIQENSKLAIVATAQRLVADLSDRASPFFGFFQTEHLTPLNVEEATLLLQKLAQLHAMGNVAEFLATSRGRARVRALHHLSGGNHRIYIVLSQFITQDSIDALVGPFMQMVDELTPYYQERIRWLPPMQRKIIECLCGYEGTMPVKEIAKRLFATPQTISSQLQDLREKGYVMANQRGRESLYEISEPLMRICIEVKDNQRRQPLRLLVDFLRVWYDDRDLQSRLGKFASVSTASTYLESAKKRNSTEGNLRKQILLEDLQRSLSEELGPFEKNNMLQMLVIQPEAVLLAMQSLKDGNQAVAFTCLNEALLQDNNSLSQAEILCFRAELYNFSKDYEKALEDYSTVIACSEVPVELVVKAHLGRGLTYGKLGDPQREIDAYSTLIALPGAPVEQVSRALFNRGITYGQLGDSQREIDAYSTLIALPGAPVESVAQALLYRAFTFLQMRQKQKSQADFEAVLCLPDVPPKLAAHSRLAITAIHFKVGKWDEGFQTLAAGLETGAKAQPPHYQDTRFLIDVIFEAGLGPESRAGKVKKFLGIYETYQALSALGEAVIEHIGGLFRKGSPFPSTDNLEEWALAWEQAAVSVPDFRLAVRLLRRGVEFVKAGGKEPGSLLDLTIAERTILEQALGLAKDG